VDFHHKCNNRKQDNLLAAAKAEVKQQILPLLHSNTKLPHSLWAKVAHKPIQQPLVNRLWERQTSIPTLSDSGIIAKYNQCSLNVAARAKEVNYGFI
jgi:hypothetical protein